jgi:hypothetical protein
MLKKCVSVVNWANQGKNIRRFCTSLQSTPSSSFVAPSAPVKKDRKHHVVMRFIISGFSRFVSRQDLVGKLGAMTPTMIEPLLDPTYTPVGKYLVKFAPQCPIDSFRLEFNNSNRNKLNISVAPSSMEWILASTLAITDCTVRCKILALKYETDDMLQLFEGFALRRNGIRKIPGETFYFLIDFASPEEAQRAVIEKGFTNLRGHPIELYWYQC